MVGVRMGPPNVLGPPKPTSSISTITTLGAPFGAVTSNRAGGFAFRASSSLYVGGVGSAIGRTVRSGSVALAAGLGVCSGARPQELAAPARANVSPTAASLACAFMCSSSIE